MQPTRHNQKPQFNVNAPSMFTLKKKEKPKTSVQDFTNQIALSMSGIQPVANKINKARVTGQSAASSSVPLSTSIVQKNQTLASRGGLSANDKKAINTQQAQENKAKQAESIRSQIAALEGKKEARQVEIQKEDVRNRTNQGILDTLKRIDEANIQAKQRSEEQETIAPGRTKPFILGRQAAIERQRAAGDLPLQAQLANLQRERTFQQEEVTGAKEDQQSILDFAQEVALKGGDQQLVNSILQSGSVQEALPLAVESGLLKDSDVAEAFTLSKGQIRFDADGKVIARGGATTSGGGSGGGSGSGVIGNLSGAAQVVLDNPQAFKTLTPTAATKILNELGNAGIDTSSLFPDASSANAVRGAATVVRDATEAMERLENSPAFADDNTGIVAANTRHIKATKPIFRGSDEWEVAQLIQSVKDNVGIDALLNIKREGSGLGAVPQQQLESLQGLLGRLDVARDPKLLKRDLKDALGIYQDVLDSFSDVDFQLRSGFGTVAGAENSSQSGTDDIDAFLDSF